MANRTCLGQNLKRKRKHCKKGTDKPFYFEKETTVKRGGGCCNMTKKKRKEVRQKNPEDKKRKKKNKNILDEGAIRIVSRVLRP